MSDIISPARSQWTEPEVASVARLPQSVYVVGLGASDYAVTTDYTVDVALQPQAGGGLAIDDAPTATRAALTLISPDVSTDYAPLPTPTLGTIPGGVLWANADDLAGTFVADAPVGAFAGRIGGRGGAQSNSTKRPLFKPSVGGVSAVYGDGVDDYLDFGNLASLFGSAGTLSLSFRGLTGPAPVGGLVNCGLDNLDGWTFYPGGLHPPGYDPYWAPFRTARVEADSASTSMPLDDAWHVLTIRTGATQYRVQLDGVLTETRTPAFAAPTSITLLAESLGANPKYFKGYVHELFVSAAELSDSDAATVNTIMGAGVGLTL